MNSIAKKNAIRKTTNTAVITRPGKLSKEALGMVAWLVDHIGREYLMGDIDSCSKRLNMPHRKALIELLAPHPECRQLVDALQTENDAEEAKARFVELTALCADTTPAIIKHQAKLSKEARGMITWLVEHIGSDYLKNGDCDSFTDELKAPHREALIELLAPHPECIHLVFALRAENDAEVTKNQFVERAEMSA